MAKFSFSPFGAWFRRYILLAASLAGAAPLAPQIAAAQAGGPFASFSGEWRGDGQVIGKNGDRERIRCRANYEVSKQGAALTQTLVCASDSYRVDISGYFVADGQRVQGYWKEATRQVQGELSGRIVDGRFEGRVAGPTFTAEISLTSADGKQAVAIKPQGANVADVDVVLRRES